ncbi:bacterio-opsin activator domain-containing protein [Salinilacihabitans rarus]|uniref:bacterio-opsin activator domain-containing protein n=1 Tax=Salinilacihabitans rarus TaxID=2961596 RepID=UPI0020C83806|nr:bacterio-opsin activator domain-containing protein [Salinilacihabitans rarus]
MEDVDTERNSRPVGGGEGAAAALAYVVDPVVAVVDGTVAYANEAARDAFDLPPDADGRPAETVLNGVWETLEEEIAEATVGTSRHVALDHDGYDARVHRGADGATVTFETADGRPTDTDRAVKARAVDEAPVGVTISDPSREDNPLVYVNEAYREITGYTADEVVGQNCRFLQGEDTDPKAVAEMRRGIDAEEPVTVEVRNYRKDGSPFWNEVTIAPVRDDRGDLTHYVGFQNEITARKEAELEAERRREELEYILDRVEGLIQDVTAAVAGSTSRSDLEAAVCERVAEEPAYEGAWIGERNPATETVEVRAAATVDPEDVPAGSDHPAAATLATADAAVERVDGATLAAFPLQYNDVEYGVLVVRTADERPVEERERVILSALTRAVASGVNARETSRTLATDAVVAVELEVVDRSLAPVALSADADCRLEYNRSVQEADATAAVFTAAGASTADIEAAAADLDGIELETLVEGEDGGVVELASTDGPDLVSWLSDRGVVVRSIEAEGGSASVALDVPRSKNVRGVVEAVEERYPGTDVTSFRGRERDGDTRRELAARLEADLTDRQFATLQRAYLGGYFEWPRPTTGEELAQSMGVARPTFHEHLRTAEAKLCRAFFGDD